MESRRRAQPKPESFKVVLVGDKHVGKTSIVQRYIHNSFDMKTEGTIGASFYSKFLKLKTSADEPEVPIKL